MTSFRQLNINILTGLRAPPMTGLKNMFRCAHVILVVNCLAEVLDSFVVPVYCGNDQ